MQIGGAGPRLEANNGANRARRPFSRPASTKKTQTVTHLSRISLVACGLLPKVAVVWLRFIAD